MNNIAVLPWVQTYTGKKFNFLNITPDSICIEDIAHALSNICRYTGHTKEFYSVAQHSIIASEIVPEEDAFDALMHDATEAYLSDISRPLKTLLPEYKKLEKKVYKAIADKFNLLYDLPTSVKEADLILLSTEKRDLLGNVEADEWTIIKSVEPLAKKIYPLKPKEAEEEFLLRYTLLLVKEACNA